MYIIIIDFFILLNVIKNIKKYTARKVAKAIELCIIL